MIVFVTHRQKGQTVPQPSPQKHTDPLLQPFALRHLKLRNRIVSTAHAPAYVEDGHPRDRYRLYHEEKAKGGLGLTIIGGSTNIAPDSPGQPVCFRSTLCGRR